jgi:hypothetical protein
MIDSLKEFVFKVITEFNAGCHQFEVMYQEEADGRYLVVLGAGTWKVKVISNLMDFTCSVGPWCAPNTWADGLDGLRLWYPTRLMVAFVRSRVRPSKEEANRGLDMRPDSEILKEAVSDIMFIYGTLSELFEEERLDQTLVYLGEFIKRRATETEKMIYRDR